ncbi:hypothetical protein D3C86_1889420 [compost metagenome]
MQPLGAELAELMIETERQATGFRIGKIVTTNAGIQPFHAVDDQPVNGVTGSKSKTTENVVVESRKGIGMVFNGIRRCQHFQRLIGMLTKSGANKNGRDVGAH